MVDLNHSPFPESPKKTSPKQNPGWNGWNHRENKSFNIIKLYDTEFSYGGHHWSRWFLAIRFRFSILSEVRTTPRWTITARNSYINSCSSPNCSMCFSTSAKRSIKAWSTWLAWWGGMLRFRPFSPHLLLLSNSKHILLKLCLSQGCHTMKFHTLVITCHLSETFRNYHERLIEVHKAYYEHTTEKGPRTYNWNICL